MDMFTFIVLLVYLLATGYLGYLGYRQTKTASDYLVAGRNANPDHGHRSRIQGRCQRNLA